MALAVCLLFDRRSERAVREPEKYRASDIHTKAVDEADDVYDPAELAEVDDEL